MTNNPPEQQINSPKLNTLGSDGQINETHEKTPEKSFVRKIQSLKEETFDPKFINEAFGPQSKISLSNTSFFIF